MKNLLTFKYWLMLNPGPLVPLFQQLLIAFIVVMVLLSLGTFIYNRRNSGSIYKKVWGRVHSFLLTNVIIGLLLLFLTYETIPFFSSRFWFLLWTLVDAIWAYFIIKHMRRIPKRKLEFEREREFKKYIP